MSEKSSNAVAAAADIVIVGGGLAGLFCALKLAPRKVTVLAAAPIGEGASTAWAQGGIAAAVSEGDTPESHAQDTVAVGGGIVDEAIALGVMREAPERVRDLLAYGVPFDQDLEGHLLVSREAAHSARRIVRVKGDMAGRAIMTALIAAVRATPSITVLEGYSAEELLADGNAVIGLRARAALGQSLHVASNRIVLATGGVGHLYAVTTNPAEAAGSGLAIAARVGARIADAEFVQFHPTAIDIGRDPAPLATEALRGDGAILVNRAGERFMERVHPLGDLAPRDIVARGVFSEIAAGRGAFLDARTAIGDRFKDLFPTVYASCMSAGVDPARDLIPIAPAAHYHMGGIAVDARGRSSLDGLWAAGEVASTGTHGANRLASNSLLEAVVYAGRIARDIDGSAAQAQSVRTLPAPAVSHDLPESDSDLRKLMARHVGVVRDAEGLSQALRTLGRFNDSARSAAMRNMLVTATMIAAAAWQRRESRGAHFRSDYPEPDPAQARRTFMTWNEAKAIAQTATAAEPSAAK